MGALWYADVEDMRCGDTLYYKASVCDGFASGGEGGGGGGRSRQLLIWAMPRPHNSVRLWAQGHRAARTAMVGLGSLMESMIALGAMINASMGAMAPLCILATRHC